MFVEKLTSQEKRSLVQLLTYTARSDGKIERQEWQYLNRFCDKHGLTYDINEENNLDHICGAIQSKAAKVVAMQHVVRMALADGCYEQREKENVHEISNMLGLDDVEFKRIENWAIEGFEWLKKGEAMVADG